MTERKSSVMTDKEKNLIVNHLEKIMIERDFKRWNYPNRVGFKKENVFVNFHHWFDAVEIEVEIVYTEKRITRLNYDVYSVEELDDLFTLLIKHKKL